MQISTLWKADLWLWDVHCLAHYPHKGPLYPTDLHAAYKHGGLTPPALQAPEHRGRSPCSHDLVHRATNPSYPRWQAHLLHPYHSRSLVKQPTVSSFPPELVARVSWTKAGQEAKCSLERLCKANWMQLWPPILPKWHRNESYRRCYLNSQFFFLFRSLRE